MNAMRIYLVRHADADYRDDRLTVAGQQEAWALAQRFADHGLDALYCSPAQRAHQTALVTGKVLGMKPKRESWLAEPNDWRIDHPVWGSLAVWDLPGEVMQARLYGNLADPGLPYEAIRQHKELVRTHSDALLLRHGYQREDQYYRYQQPNRQRVAVFAHHGIGLMWLAHLLGLPLGLVWSGFWLAPSSVTTVLFDERTPGWASPRCLTVSDVSHLYGTGLPVQPRGIIANFE